MWFFRKNERTGSLPAGLGPSHPSHVLNPGFRGRALNRRRRRSSVFRVPVLRYRSSQGGLRVEKWCRGAQRRGEEGEEEV